MPHWLRCTILPGQFSDEYVVEGQSANGEGFSLFCPQEFLEFESEPTWEMPVDGWVQVKVLQTKRDVLLICLPRHTLENGLFATVKKDAVERRPVREKA